MHTINSLKTILISVIESIDQYNFLLKDHHRRTATIAYQLASEYGLSSEQVSNVVLTASIHDIGALHVSERDKLLFIDAVDTEPHEILGANIVSGFKPLEYIGKIIRHHHIRYEECLSGKYDIKDIPLESFFIHLADRIDVLLLTNEGSDDIKNIVIKEINQRFGSIFLPDLESAFNQLVLNNDFWTNINEASYHDLLMMSLQTDVVDIKDEDLESLASLFARIVDFKSKWTASHSKSVGILAFHIGQLMDLSNESCLDLKVSGYLHDLGKIAIPTEILEKASSLTKEEFEIMKSHANYTSLILSKISGIETIAKWAVSHHEKRDRSGYPLKRSLKDFTIEMDIIAYADIFSALAQDRPYRNALSQEKILDLLQTYAPNKLDESVFLCVKEHMDELYLLTQTISDDFDEIYS